MNYTEIIKNMRDAAGTIHNLNSFNDDDIYDSWIRPDIKFSALNVYLMNAQRTNSTIEYTIMVYYGDRLLEDGSNRNAIWDDGINVILTWLERLDDEISYTIPVVFNPFEQKFADNLAGVYCQLTIEAEYELGRCGLETKQMNEDL